MSEFTNFFSELGKELTKKVDLEKLGRKDYYLNPRKSADDLLNIAMAPQAGMLKAQAGTRLISEWGRLLKFQDTERKKSSLTKVLSNIFGDLDRLPKEAFRTTKDVRLAKTETSGSFELLKRSDPFGLRGEQGLLKINPTESWILKNRGKTILSHELTHGAQFYPETFMEKRLSREQMKLLSNVLETRRKLYQGSPSKGFIRELWDKDPVEIGARMMESLTGQGVTSREKFNAMLWKGLEHGLDYSQRSLK